MKAAIVVQRYGLEVNGGAEYHCRLLAEHLSKYFEVSVLTTCALDYMEWRNHYPTGLSEVNGIPVHRFEVEKPRNVEEFNRFSEQVLLKPHSDAEELHWMDLQGPYCPSLLDHIRHNVDTYDFFVFFTYLYYTTFHGLPLVADKSLLVPTAHDELPVRLRIFRKVFTSPRTIVYNTRAERDFVHSLFQNRNVPHAVVGTGVEIPQGMNYEGFSGQCDIDHESILYVGRIDESKGCGELFEYFSRYKSQRQTGLKLVLAGKPVMVVPRHPDIISIGFVSEVEKFSALAKAKVVVLPSPYESLSMVNLEAWMLEKPVLSNGRSRALRDNCVFSNGGLYYTSYEEFQACLDYLLHNPSDRAKMGSNGHAYVEANYSWPAIEKKYLKIIDECIVH